MVQGLPIPEGEGDGGTVVGENNFRLCFSHPAGFVLYINNRRSASDQVIGLVGCRIRFACQALRARSEFDVNFDVMR